MWGKICKWASKIRCKFESNCCCKLKINNLDKIDDLDDINININRIITTEV